VTNRGLLWTAAAIGGIVLTAALAWSASLLAGQRIGLASEPVSVSAGLAPRALGRASPHAPRRGQPVRAARVHRAAPAPPPAAASVQTPTTAAVEVAPAPVVTSPPPVATVTTAAPAVTVTAPAPQPAAAPSNTQTADSTPAQPSGRDDNLSHRGSKGRDD
jgi:hypothetical protein